MTPLHKKRLTVTLLLGIGIGIAITLALYALNSNINLFYTPKQVVENLAPINRTFRVGGMVKPGSVVRNRNNLWVKFTITDYHSDVVIWYRGILPDLFREGQGIVAEGKLNQQHDFIAAQVLAKHDENYMPPEVKYALAAAREKKQ